ncbi:MAG: hypothetical protein AB8F78_16890 [Saprospiraceae bacterium]
MAQSVEDEHEEVKALYYDIHDKIELDTTTGAVFHEEVIEVLKTAMAERPETLHGVALLAAVEVANRLETRGALLTRISSVAYGHNFQTKSDTVHASWVFCLGIIEHA